MQKINPSFLRQGSDQVVVERRRRSPEKEDQASEPAEFDFVEIMVPKARAADEAERLEMQRQAELSYAEAKRRDEKYKGMPARQRKQAILAEMEEQRRHDAGRAPRRKPASQEKRKPERPKWRGVIDDDEVQRQDDFDE